MERNTFPPPLSSTLWYYTRFVNENVRVENALREDGGIGTIWMYAVARADTKRGS